MTSPELIRHWIDRCAVQNCEPELQEQLLDILGKHTSSALSCWGEAAQGLRRELFSSDSQVNRISFYDRLFYHKNPTDALTRALKSLLLGKTDSQLSGNVNQRLRSLVRNKLTEDYGRRPGGHVASDRESVSKSYFIPSLDDPAFGLKDIPDTQAELPGTFPLTEIRDLLIDPEFGEEAQRFFWLRFYPKLCNTEEVKNFVGVVRAQIYNKSAPFLSYVGNWIKARCPASTQAQFCYHIFLSIQQRLLAENAIPQAWLPLLNSADPNEDISQP